jgi:hypothetical protein
MRVHIQFRPDPQWLSHCSAASALDPTLRPLLLRHTMRHSAALVFLVARQRIEVGSATAILVGERYFLATAGHNLADIPKDRTIRIVAPGPASECWLPFVGRHACAERGPGSMDVGWIELETTVARATGLRFLPVNDLAPTHRSEEAPLYLVQGSPARMVSLDDRNGQRSIQLTAIGCVTEATPGRTPRDLALRYGRTTIGRRLPAVALPPAHGLSGGGVWTLPRPVPGGAPKPSRLVGLVRAWHRGDRRLDGIPIRRWLRLLRQDLPDLAPHLDPVLEALT